jgi:ubiquinone/menaquinone biosynthesis C-methylase UbiE
VAREPLGFTALARVFNLVWVHEDFNALWYYRRMAREAFLSGLSHRPWAKDLLEDQLRVYRTAGLVQEIFTGLGDMLELTAHGATMYRRLREVLEQAGEFLWRSEQQRWVLFHQLDFDRVFAQLFPDAATRTEHFLSRLPLTKGLRILEVGAGTGRIIFDHGLFRRVLPGGTVVALDSSPRMLARLGQKRRACRARHVRIIHGYGESLPFADAQFDVTMAVMALHFMDAPQVLAEMIRVTRPGGTVAVMSPHPGFDIRQIPMMALWMRPIYDLADRFQLPSTERNGLRPGELRQWFFEHPRLMSPHYERVPMLATVQPHREAFAFYVQGAAIFQNVLARLPYAERQNFLKRLMEQGDMIASQTSDSEKQYTYYPEMAWGCVK